MNVVEKVGGGLCAGCFFLDGCQKIRNAWQPHRPPTHLVDHKITAVAFLAASILGLGQWVVGARTLGTIGNLLYIPYYWEEIYAASKAITHAQLIEEKAEELALPEQKRVGDVAVRSWVELIAAVSWIAFALLTVIGGPAAPLTTFAGGAFFAASSFSFFDRVCNLGANEGGARLQQEILDNYA